MTLRFPTQGLLGLALVAVCWPLNWGLEGLRTHLLFFPLWLGYILVVDALNERRTGTSPWRRSRRRFMALFLASIPIWWLFEAVNLRTGNWQYVGRGRFGDLEYVLLASLSFSTVLPAVAETAELLRSSTPLRRLAHGPRLRRSETARVFWIVTGLAATALLLALPRFAYPLTWIFLIPLLLGVLPRRGVVAHLSAGDWRTLSAWAMGALVCGFFWELWNARSYPYWNYTTPGFERSPHLFAMPLPGYLGYLPFGAELALLECLLLPRRDASA